MSILIELDPDELAVVITAVEESLHTLSYIPRELGDSVDRAQCSLESAYDELRLAGVEHLIGAVG